MTTSPERILLARLVSVQLTDLLEDITAGPADALLALAYTSCAISVVRLKPGGSHEIVKKHLHEIIDIIYPQLQKTYEAIK